MSVQTVVDCQTLAENIKMRTNGVVICNVVILQSGVQTSIYNRETGAEHSVSICKTLDEAYAFLYGVFCALNLAGVF